MIIFIIYFIFSLGVMFYLNRNLTYAEDVINNMTLEKNAIIDVVNKQTDHTLIITPMLKEGIVTGSMISLKPKKERVDNE